MVGGAIFAYGRTALPWPNYGRMPQELARFAALIIFCIST